LCRKGFRLLWWRSSTTAGTLSGRVSFTGTGNLTVPRRVRNVTVVEMSFRINAGTSRFQGLATAPVTSSAWWASDSTHASPRAVEGDPGRTACWGSCLATPIHRRCHRHRRRRCCRGRCCRHRRRRCCRGRCCRHRHPGCRPSHDHVRESVCLRPRAPR